MDVEMGGQKKQDTTKRQEGDDDEKIGRKRKKITKVLTIVKRDNMFQKGRESDHETHE